MIGARTKFRRMTLAFVLLLCLWCSPAGAGIMDNITRRGELRIGVMEDVAPFSFVDKEGVRTGAAVEFARMMAQEMGVEPVFVPAPYKDLTQTLLDRKADLVVGYMTPNLKEAMQVSFTDAFYRDGPAVFMKKGRYFKSIEDCDRGIVTVAVVQGSKAEGDVGRVLPCAKVKRYKRLLDVVNAVVKGQADIGAGVKSVLISPLTKFPADSVEFLPKKLSYVPIACAVRHEDDELLHWVNLFFEWSRGDGRHEKQIRYWFENTEWTKRQ